MVVYSGHSFLKKGPLGRAWASAHFERKLGRNQINEADIVKIADAILDPEAHFSLRIFAYLLLGLVRLYSRKLEYLLRDSSESLRKIKKSFPLAAASAAQVPPSVSISVDFDEFEPLSDHVWSVDRNVSLAENITLSVRDEDGNDLFLDDERFPPECTLQAFEEPASKSFPSEAPNELVLQETEGDEDDVADEPDLEETEGSDENGVPFEPRTPPTKAASNPRIHRLREEPSQRPPVNRALATEFEKFLSKNRSGVSVDPPELEGRGRIENKRVRGGPGGEYLLEYVPGESGLEAVCSKENLLESCELAEGNSPRTPVRVPRARCRSIPPRKRKGIAFDTPSILTQEFLREQLLDVSDLVRSRKKVSFRSRVFSGPSVPGMCSDLQEVFARSPKPRASDPEPCSALIASEEAAEEPLVASEMTIAGVNKEVDRIESAQDSNEDEPDQAPADTSSVDSDSLEPPSNFSCSGNSFATCSQSSRFAAEAEVETEETCTSSTGWSERTKVLGQYLKSVLNRDSRTTPRVKLDQILANKTRRVAACTLVLKTRDYIQVEQPGAYQAIRITSRPKLMEDASL